MKEEIIKKSKSLGFISKVFSEAEITSELDYYLWMCELQKWLREKHNIDVYVVPNGSRNKSINENLYHPILWLKDEYQSELHYEKKYELALEKVLFEALKLIKS